MAKFSLNEIAIIASVGNPKFGYLVGSECEIVALPRSDSWVYSDGERIYPDHYVIRIACGDVMAHERDLIKRPGQSKEDQEARERFLKGCHEKPNFHEILSDLQPVTEETARKVFEQSMWRVK